MPILNISLTPELVSMIDKKLATGMHHTASEIVRDGLRLLNEKDELRLLQMGELKRQIKIGTDQLDRGESDQFTSGSELTRQVKSNANDKRIILNRA